VLPWLFVMFVLMPIVEIAVLLNVGAAIGWVPTILIVILTAILGTFMLRQQGLATMLAARQRMRAGELPAQQIIEGMLLLVGGALLLTPGFVTDTIGFVCLVPLTRQRLARYIVHRSRGGFDTLQTGRGPDGGPTGTESTDNTADVRQRQSGSVIEGEFKRDD